MAPKLSNLSNVLGYWNENMNQDFRFYNPKQFSNWMILVSFYSSNRVIKKVFYAFFYKNFNIFVKNGILFDKFEFYCVLTRILGKSLTT
jgi:hypothetical protein